MRILGVIPARYGSTRFSGKPLVPVAGKPLLQWVIEGAKTSTMLSDVWVATDHKEIFILAEKCGVKAVMTDSTLPSGSDRVWAAIQNEDCDIAVNIQGDEPLLTGELLDSLVGPFFDDSQVEMSTLGCPLEEDDLESLSRVKIVINKRNEAIYFSRLPIPFSRVDVKQLSGVCCKHIGLYAYRKQFLQRFCEQGPVDLEKAENLEQLRALYLGARIRVVGVKHGSWGVDSPEDVAKIDAIIQTGRGHGRT